MRFGMLRSIAGLVLILVEVLLPTGGAPAQTYPSRPIKMIVPFAAGGPSDVADRTLADALRGASGSLSGLRTSAGQEAPWERCAPPNAPKATPGPVVDRIGEALQATLNDQDFQSKAKAVGREIVSPDLATPAGAAVFLQAEID